VSTSGEWKLRVMPIERSREQMYFSLQTVKNLLPSVLIRVRIYLLSDIYLFLFKISDK
jgi:hypothetical protein